MINIEFIIGSNYGDEGKGAVTNRIAKKFPKLDTVVVMGSGGAQRGHTVETSTYRHVFHHFGSATLSGYDTYIWKDFICNPIIFNQEYFELETKIKKMPTIYLDNRCIVTFPFHMLVNQMCEKWQQKVKGVSYGSCGLGIYTTIMDAKRHNLHIKNVIDSFDLYKTFYTEEYFREFVTSECGVFDEELGKEYIRILNDKNVWNNFEKDLLNMYNRCVHVDSVEEVGVSNFIVEMSQGLMLSPDNKDKYCTPMLCSSKQCKRFVKDVKRISNDVRVRRNYVTRWYMTRHGNSHLQHMTDREHISLNIVDKTNIYNEWQGNMVFGYLDCKELGKRIKKDRRKMHSDRQDVLYVTCMNQSNNGTYAIWKNGFHSVDMPELILNIYKSTRLDIITL